LKGENSNSLLKTYEKLIVDIDKKDQAAIGGWLRMASNSRISSGRELLSSQRMGIIFAPPPVINILSKLATLPHLWVISDFI